MTTKDGFQPDRSPIFLAEPAEEIGQADIGKALDRAVISSRILKASIWAATATAIGIAILLVGDPVALVENVAATWVEKPALQPDAGPPTPAIQAIAGTQDLPTKTTDAPARDETAAALEPADQRQAEIGQTQAETGQPVTEELFKQFQAWAAEEQTRAQAKPAQPVQAAPVKVVQDTPVRVRPVKKHRQVRSVQNARAEIRPQRHHRARVREEQDAQIPPVADPRAQDQSSQTAQPPSLLQSLGLRN